MKKRSVKIALCTFLALAALLVGVFASGAVFANGSSSQTIHKSSSSGSSITTSATKATTALVSGHSMNVYSMPKSPALAATGKQAMPLLYINKNQKNAKQNIHNKNAPVGGQALSATADLGATTNGTSAISRFSGMADSASICPYFGGCQPPDMALATSSQYEFQGVNTSFALYGPHGALLAGPTNAQNFFGVPNPSPSGCDPNGPFLSDPRAFYDPNTGYFWAATLQLENAFGLGFGCNFLSQYWIANFNPTTGAGCTYSFDMALSTTNVADYTQFGFSGSTISFTGNMFDQFGNYAYAETQFASKQAMQQCLSVTPTAFTGLGIYNIYGNFVPVDTVQPVETETTKANDPGVQYLVNAFNGFGDALGDDCFFTACQGFIVWMYDPSSGTLSGWYVDAGGPTNPTYISPPLADEPGCLFCVETLDNRISGTPVYSVGGGQGLISFALETGVSNGGPLFPNVVPGILWGQIQVTHVPGFVLANLYQSGYLYFTGDRAASFGAMMQAKNGTLYMVFDTMSANLNPSVMIASRLKSDPLGSMTHTSFIIRGPSATIDFRWGDFEAASYTGYSTNQVWVASQYSVSGDWNTVVARVQ